MGQAEGSIVPDWHWGQSGDVLPRDVPGETLPQASHWCAGGAFYLLHTWRGSSILPPGCLASSGPKFVLDPDFSEFEYHGYSDPGFQVKPLPILQQYVLEEVRLRSSP